MFEVFQFSLREPQDVPFLSLASLNSTNIDFYVESRYFLIELYSTSAHQSPVPFMAPSNFN